MSPTYQLLLGDALQQLRMLPEASVHCVVTSPPYWRLRDYGVEGQLGLEPTIQEFVTALVEVFREVRRVLRPDGTAWLNLGDCYYGTGYGQKDTGKAAYTAETWPQDRPRSGDPTGLKPKDLVGAPWRVALALQDDGWWLRRDCIWHKPDGMPENVNDRPTGDHEYVFLLAPSRRYEYDLEAVRQPHAKPYRDAEDYARQNGQHRKHLDGRRDYLPRFRGEGGLNAGVTSYSPRGRNLRSVWTISTSGFSEAHFATFPPELPRLCILAGTSEAGCCPACLAPLRRIVEDGEPDLEHQRACGGDSRGQYHGRARQDRTGTGAPDPSELKRRILKGMRVRRTAGWAWTCDCPPADPTPCTVLDPFAGAGTAGVVALQLGRSFVGVELSPEFHAMASERLEAARAGLTLREHRGGQLPLFATSPEQLSLDLGEGEPA